MARRARRNELFENERRELLDAVGRCRGVILKHQAALRYGSPTYVLGSAIIDAIDTLAGFLTGDKRYFHTPPHSDIRP
jgi:hypothetical protein